MSLFQYGCFRKWGNPQIIHFNRVFHCKSSILGYHHLRKPPYGIILGINFLKISGPFRPFAGKFRGVETRDAAGAGEGLIGKPCRLHGEHWMITVDCSKKKVSPGWLGSFFCGEVFYIRPLVREDDANLIAISGNIDGESVCHDLVMGLQSWNVHPKPWRNGIKCWLDHTSFKWVAKKHANLSWCLLYWGPFLGGWFSQLDPQQTCATWPPQGTTLAVLVDHGRGCHLH